MAGKIVFDRYRIMGHVDEAIDKVCKQEHRARLTSGDATLTGTKSL